MTAHAQTNPVRRPPLRVAGARRQVLRRRPRRRGRRGRTQSGIKDEALRVFKDELGHRPELTTTAPPGLPTGDDPDALEGALKKKGMKALELTLRIMAVTQQVKPPAPGKQYRQLVRGIKLSVFGDSLPDKVLAIGGDGEAEVASEVGANANLDNEGKPLIVDACKEAVKQAVDMTVAKLKMGDKRAKAAAKKRR